jgi:hypothetical protein
MLREASRGNSKSSAACPDIEQLAIVSEAFSPDAVNTRTVASSPDDAARDELRQSGRRGSRGGLDVESLRAKPASACTISSSVTAMISLPRCANGREHFTHAHWFRGGVTFRDGRSVTDAGTIDGDVAVGLRHSLACLFRAAAAETTSFVLEAWRLCAPTVKRGARVPLWVYQERRIGIVCNVSALPPRADVDVDIVLRRLVPIAVSGCSNMRCRSQPTRSPRRRVVATSLERQYRAFLVERGRFPAAPVTKARNG